MCIYRIKSKYDTKKKKINPKKISSIAIKIKERGMHAHTREATILTVLPRHLLPTFLTVFPLAYVHTCLFLKK